MEGTRAFSCIDLPARSAKPRRQGFTMMMDWGVSLAEQQSIVEATRDYADFAKIVVGIGGLFSVDYLSRKIAHYLENGIETFPGGMFLEVALTQGKVEEYLEACRQVGFTTVEVSDNAIELDAEEKARVIRLAREGYGLQVMGEVGKKAAGVTNARAMIEDIRLCLDAGSRLVLLEAMEFTGGADAEAMIGEITAAVPWEKLLFELPATWMPGVTDADIHAMAENLLARFGPDANIANVAAERVLALEAMRLGIGVRSEGH